MHARPLIIAAAVAAAVTGLVVPAASAGSVPAAGPVAEAVSADRPLHDDFNRDGHADLVVATPDAEVDGVPAAGNVVITYGSASGVAPSRSTTISQNSAGVPGAAEASDRFGQSVTSGDLDGDGYADLVVGHENETVSGSGATGMVTVVWGGPNGLVQGGSSVPRPEGGGTFGRDVAVDDLDGDGGQNLAVLGSDRLVTYADGLNRTTPGRPLPVEGGEFGGDPYLAGLVTGDFTGSGSAGLIVYGTEDHDEGSGSWLGWFTGGPGGVHYVRNLADGSIPATSSAAVGDIDHDGLDDLVTGSPGPHSDSVDDPSLGSGLITVRHGSPQGPGQDRAAAVLYQGTPGVPGADEPEDRFGAAVAVGDVTGDGFADVAVGVPGETVDSVPRTGSVVLLKGSAGGLTGDGAQAFHQATPGVPGVAETDDHLGSALEVADVNANGRADVSIGAEGEDVTPGAQHDGAVWVLRGSSSGLTSTNATSFSAPAFGFTFTDRRFGSVLGDGS